MKDSRRTIKMPPDTHRLLRQIAAATGEKQYTVLHRLLTQEWARVQQEAPDARPSLAPVPGPR